MSNDTPRTAPGENPLLTPAQIEAAAKVISNPVAQKLFTPVTWLMLKFQAWFGRDV